MNLTCKKDYITQDGKVAFKAGNTYSFKPSANSTSFIGIDELGDEHFMTAEDLFERKGIGMKNLDKAILLAAEAHAGQFDKGGKPYILHPLHLMQQLLFDPELAQIAVLHDVVEDSNMTFEQLVKLGFSNRVIDALTLLTHNPSDSYEDYILGIATNQDAIKVKRKDLEHNSDITRLKGVTDKDLERMKKYHKAFLFLGENRT